MIPTKQAVSRSSHHSLLQSIDSWRPSLEVEPPPPWVPSLFSQPPLPPIPQQYLPLCLVTSLLQLHILTIDGYPGLGIITFTLCAALGEIVRGKSDGGRHIQFLQTILEGGRCHFRSDWRCPGEE